MSAPAKESQHCWCYACQIKTICFQGKTSTKLLVH